MAVGVNRFYTFGYNTRHYSRAMYNGELLIYCPKCDDYHSPESFHKQNTTRGYSSYCKVCTSEVNRKYREKQKKKLALS